MGCSRSSYACGHFMVTSLLFLAGFIFAAVYFDERFTQMQQTPESINATISIEGDQRFLLLEYRPWMEPGVPDVRSLMYGVSIPLLLVMLYMNYGTLFETCSALDRYEEEIVGFEKKTTVGAVPINQPRYHSAISGYNIGFIVLIFLCAIFCTIMSFVPTAASSFDVAKNNPGVWYSENQFQDQDVIWTGSADWDGKVVYYQGDISFVRCGYLSVTFVREYSSGDIMTPDGKTWQRVCIKSDHLKSFTSQEKYLSWQRVVALSQYGFFVVFSLLLTTSFSLFSIISHALLKRKLKNIKRIQISRSVTATSPRVDLSKTVRVGRSNRNHGSRGGSSYRVHNPQPGQVNLEMTQVSNLETIQPGTKTGTPRMTNPHFVTNGAH